MGGLQYFREPKVYGESEVGPTIAIAMYLYSVVEM